MTHMFVSCTLVGEQFERLVNLVKQALYKGIGRAGLFWSELEEVLLDVEVMMCNDLF